MAHEDAKRLLELAATFAEREAAVRQAIALGMPLNEIEQYLDWLDNHPAPPRGPAGQGRAEA